MYSELHCKTNFSFLTGASHADELIPRAIELGYRALAVTDENSLAGVVRAYAAARQCRRDAELAAAEEPTAAHQANLARATSFRLIIGAEITPIDAPPVLLWATDRQSYGNLSKLITLGRRQAPKGECLLTLNEIASHQAGLLAGALPGKLVLSGSPSQSTQLAPESITAERVSALAAYREIFGERASLMASFYCGIDDRWRMAQLTKLSQQTSLPLAAAGDVLYHVPARLPLHDVLTATKHHTTVASAGDLLLPNAQRHLQTIAHRVASFAGLPKAIERANELAERCKFCLSQLRYEYPEELAPTGQTPIGYLRDLTFAGAANRYPAGVPAKVKAQLEHELQLIDELRYEAYFLTVWDLVRFARRRGILCQGRGSAANSAVCFCLGVTSVDPGTTDLLFERFISKERDEAPDIDVDFEHERREEVLQYLYSKYGRDRAGLAATVVTYRTRSAVRDVGKALGLSLDRVDALAKHVEGYGNETDLTGKLADVGIDPESDVGRQLNYLVNDLLGFPRHLSQHVGGMVITQGKLDELVPIENASMEDRTVIQWDKDDLEELGLLKVDCLCLGMLSAIRKCFNLVEQHWSRPCTLANIPQEDPRVYDMICAADTVGVFQIESRGQMSMLPRLKPRCWYDLVIEVAIVRPGPIQGNMVHPYLRRRNGEEPAIYPNEAIRAVLERTLGVPIFQEQAMKLAVVAAGFTPGEADQLRRAMGKWRKTGVIQKFKEKLMLGMKERGLSGEFAEQVFRQISGFGEYGFPESHAASFAKLVYVSCWLKYYYPAAFCAALINSQPMGFYAPAQLVADARQHGVQVLPVDVNKSTWDCTLERLADEEECEVVGDEREGAEVVGIGCESTKGLGAEVVGVEVVEAEVVGAEVVGVEVVGVEVAKGFDDAEAGVAADLKSEISNLKSEISNPHPQPHLKSQISNLKSQISNLKSQISNSQISNSQIAVSSTSPQPLALRLGLRMISGLRATTAEAIETARLNGPFNTISEFTQRTGLGQAVVAQLSKADAFGSLNQDRRAALWQALGQEKKPKDQPLFASLEAEDDDTLALPTLELADQVTEDYRTIGLSLKAHPMSFYRDSLDELRVTTCAGLDDVLNNRFLKIAGLVILKQRPSTAKGITFVTLEDETGAANLVVKPNVWERYYKIARRSSAWIAHGKLEKRQGVTHVIVSRLEDMSSRLEELQTKPRNFR